MAFGKRGSGEGPTGRRPIMDDAGEGDTPGAPLGGVRTRVSNHGDIDRNFIGLAVGVVILSAGGAIAAPSLFSMFAGGVRPIEQVIAGLDRKGVEAALAAEAFPDDAGRVFMTSLAANFPNDHERLVDRLADAATAGSDRDDLFNVLNLWSMEFTLDHLDAVGRTGAEGFDRAVSVATDALRVLEKEAGGCTLNSLQAMIMDSDAFADFSAYGGDGYRLGMRAQHMLVDLAAKGAKAQTIDARITPDDENALRSTFISLMMDDQVMGLIQASATGGQPDPAVMNKLNVCQLGRTILIKLEGLPESTKGRLWATAMSADPGMLMNGAGFGAPFGGEFGSPFGAIAPSGAR